MLKIFKKPEVIVSGIAAYDKYYAIDGNFSHYIDSIKKISVGIPVYFLRSGFGGSGANIAYSLKKSGTEAMLWSHMGIGFETYASHLDKNMISYYFLEDNNFISPECAIYIDKRDNKISFFANGALESDKKIDKKLVFNKINWAKIKLAVIAPDLAKNSLSFCKIIEKRKIKYVFDPGAKIFDFTFNEFGRIDGNAYITILNDQEALIYKKLHKKDIIKTSKAKYLIITQGAQGVSIYENGRLYCKKGIIRAKKVVSTVGCGDAFRGGLIKGLISENNLNKAFERGLKLASIKASSAGTQDY